MKSSVRGWVASMTLATGLVAASAAWAQDKAPVKIGLIDIYSGGVAFIAEMIKAGFEVALDEANAAGGLNGRMFELETADMGFKVEKAVTEARRMILEQNVKFLSVGIHSGAAVAVSAIGKEQNAVVVGGFAVTKRLTGEAGHDFVGRANLSTVELGAIMAEYLRDRGDVKTISTIAPVSACICAISWRRTAAGSASPETSARPSTTVILSRKACSGASAGLNSASAAPERSCTQVASSPSPGQRMFQLGYQVPCWVKKMIMRHGGPPTSARAGLRSDGRYRLPAASPIAARNERRFKSFFTRHLLRGACGGGTGGSRRC